MERIGYGEYASVFVENEVDGDALEGLDKELLKEMGLVKVGPRAKVIKAIKNLVEGEDGGGGSYGDV